MLNFRYHVVSLVAVFLALAIGIIMGTTVIDRALVDRLEEQQEALREGIREARSTNEGLRAEVRQREAELEQVTERVVPGALDGVPVLSIGLQGAEPEGWGDLRARFDMAGAESTGELSFTQRFFLGSETDRIDMAAILDVAEDASPAELRTAALSRLAAQLRANADAAEEPDADTDTGADPPVAVIGPMIDAGFLEYEPPEAAPDRRPAAAPGTVAVLFSSDPEGVPMLTTLATELAVEEGPAPRMPVVAVEAASGRTATRDDRRSLTAELRADDETAEAVATVDNVADPIGRLAVILAVADAHDGVTGHYGVADGATRLLPSPPPTDPEG